MTQATYDVVLSGFGPTGACLAGLLGRAGRRVCVVERDRDVYALPRAVHFDHEVMRIFQTLGLAEEILPITRATDFAEFWTADREVLLHVPFNATTDQGWRSDYMFHQPSLERILRESAESYPGVEIRYGEARALHQDEDGVELELDPDDGGAATVRGRFLVGCDGANSLVRRESGMELEDLEFDEPWLVVDIEGVDEGRMPGGAIQFCDPARPTTLVPCAGGFYRFEFMLRPGEDGQEMMRPENVDRLVSAWIDPASVRLVRAAVYRFHALVARRWRAGRALIAGDAAHQTPPFLGQGMCAGIRDSINLSWKLDRVLGGDAPLELLDSYGSERTPHVREFVARAVAAGQVICVQDPEAARRRDELLLAARAAGEPPPVPLDLPLLGDGFFSESGPGRHELVAQLSPQPELDTPAGPRLMDDVTGHRFQLVHRAALRPGDKAVESLAALEGAAVAWNDGGWFDRHGVDAILVRPDHVIYGVARTDTEVEPLLAGALADLAGAQPGA